MECDMPKNTGPFGPTGDYPHGKLDKTDEGGLVMGVTAYQDNVRVDFGKPVAWFAVPPEQALALASLIVKHAMAIKAKQNRNFEDS